MFRAVVFLAGPSARDASEKASTWPHWQPQGESLSTTCPLHIYIADAGLQPFLSWYDALSAQQQSRVESVVWCGDGDSLGKHGHELRANTAARFEGRWREHLYKENKDFSDCGAITSLLEYDLRHALQGASECAWIEVHGALGGRRDHEIVNMFEFTESLLRMSVRAAYLLGADNVLTTLPLRADLESGERFSVLSMHLPSQAQVEIQGGEYSGSVFLRQPSHGLSNTVVKPPLIITPLNLKEPLLVLRSNN